MAGLPTNVGHGTVTGRFLSAEQVPGSDPEIDGVPMLGSVTFTPSVAHLLNAGAAVVIVGAPVTLNLDGTGAFTTRLVATDDPDLNPVDWTYEVLVRFASGQRLTLSIGVPTGGVVDLSRVVPVASSSGTPMVVGPQGIQGVQGVQGVPGVADDPSVAVVLTGPGQSRTVLDTTFAPLDDSALPPKQQTVRVSEAPLSLHRYGAVGDDVADDTAAVQAWASALATNHWAGHAPRGTYKLTAKINVPKQYGWTISGEGNWTTTFKQHANNVPILDLGIGVGSEMHSWAITDMGFDYATSQPAANTGATPILFSAMGYQASMRRLRFSRGSYAMRVAAGIGCPWGTTFDDLNFEAGLTIGAFDMVNGANAVPNNHFGRMFVDASNMVGPVFVLRGYNFVIDTIEFIRAFQGPMLMQFLNACEVTIGAIKVEGGTYAATKKIFEFLSDARGKIGQVFVGGDQFTITGAGTKVTALAAGGGGAGGWVDVDILDLKAASIAAGAYGFAALAAGSVPVGIGFAALANGWTLVDQGSTVSGELTTVRNHANGRLVTVGDASYVATLGGPNRVRFNVPFTAARTIDLPGVNNNLFNGLTYEIIFAGGSVNGTNTGTIRCNGVTLRTQTTDKAIVGFTYQRSPSNAQGGWVMTKYETLP